MVVAYIDGSSLFTAQSAVAVFNRFGDKVQTQVLFNPELKTSWVMVPAIIGLILTFIGTIITSIGMVKEKQTGTIEQLAVMPIKRVHHSRRDAVDVTRRVVLEVGDPFDAVHSLKVIEVLHFGDSPRPKNRVVQRKAHTVGCQ